MGKKQTEDSLLLNKYPPIPIDKIDFLHSQGKFVEGSSSTANSFSIFFSIWVSKGLEMLLIGKSYIFWNDNYCYWCFQLMAKGYLNIWVWGLCIRKELEEFLREVLEGVFSSARLREYFFEKSKREQLSKGNLGHLFKSESSSLSRIDPKQGQNGVLLHTVLNKFDLITPLGWAKSQILKCSVGAYPLCIPPKINFCPFFSL